MITAILYALLVAFAGGDALAHFTHYRYGPTVSWTIWWLEKRYPVFHIIIGVLLLLLGTHLEVHFP